MKIFGSLDRPVQIIFAGKAHPADEEGKRIIQRLIEWCRNSAIAYRVALVEDYDIYTGQKLVQGVDVWLNNPRRPLLGCCFRLSGKARASGEQNDFAVRV